jgi:hypothetical protein
MIERAEADKAAIAAQKVHNKQTLAEARKRGKEAYEAEKTRIANDKVIAAEAKKQEKFRLAALKQAAKQAEKIHQSMAKKMKAAERRVTLSFTVIKLTNSNIPKAGKRKATSTTSCHCIRPL